MDLPPGWDERKWVAEAKRCRDAYERKRFLRFLERAMIRAERAQRASS